MFYNLLHCRRAEGFMFEKVFQAPFEGFPLPVIFNLGFICCIKISDLQFLFNWIRVQGKLPFVKCQEFGIGLILVKTQI